MAKKKNRPLGDLSDTMGYLDEFAGNWLAKHSELTEAMEDGLSWLEESRKIWAEMKGVFMDYGSLDRLAEAFYENLVECADVTRDELDMSDGDWDELFELFGVFEERFISEYNYIKGRLSRAGIIVK